MIKLDGSVKILSTQAIVGKMEHEGPLGRYFKHYTEDELFGTKSFESAESKLQLTAFELACEKTTRNVDYILGGDILNQCIATNFAFTNTNYPVIGLYSACSTFTEALLLAAILAEKFDKTAAAITSSHFCTAERQYRTPLAYGRLRSPESQWTVTGAGCAILGKSDLPLPRIVGGAFGEIVDAGVTSPDNMGGAMAPAVYSTLKKYLAETNTTPDDYDLIVSGDLGLVGSKALTYLFESDGVAFGKNHIDCGASIFNKDKQKTNAGGSGAGCISSVFSAYIAPKMLNDFPKKVILMGSGALLSKTSVFQSNSIPSICHLVSLEV